MKTQFEKDVDRSEFTNEQIETIVHHFRQKVATIGNYIDCIDDGEIHNALTEAHFNLEEMLNILQSKYKNP